MLIFTLSSFHAESAKITTQNYDLFVSKSIQGNLKIYEYKTKQEFNNLQNVKN